MISASKYSQKIAELEAENNQLKSGYLQLEEGNRKLQSRVEELTAQIKWFQKQLFGQKSERRVNEPAKEQLFLGEQFQKEIAEEETQTVKEHERKKRKTRSSDGDDQKLFFDEEVVPVKEIKVANPETEGLKEDEYEVIGQKTSYRLAQRPGVYVILKYVRDVIKKKGDTKDDQKISCPAVPDSVFEKSHADVSFLGGMLIDKFQYHLPLHRQYLRLQAAGIQVSRVWLTQLVHRCGNLLEPIFDALVESIRAKRIKLIDETPVKVGGKKKGKMRTAYFWPVMGEQEIAFLYFNSREHHHVFEALGVKPKDSSVIVSDGYAAYKEYANATGIMNAQCWTHARREFVKAEEIEPERAKEALDLIRPLYSIEKDIKKQCLTGEAKRLYRLEHSKPVVDKFFTWVKKQLKDDTLLPTNRLTKALNYAHKRKDALELFLTDPEIPMSTDELERALRVIPMGRKNWLFCWTEVGAKYVGIFQSLIVTCKMNGIDPYTYLVDVLQRVADHPRADVHQLTPGEWKTHFAQNPLRSDLPI
jgi:transposase